MMLSSVNVLVKGIPIGYPPSVHLPTVHLMRQSDLVALDDRITDLKSQVSCRPVMLCAAPVLPGWPSCFVSASQQSTPCAETSRQRQKRRQVFKSLLLSLCFCQLYLVLLASPFQQQQGSHTTTAKTNILAYLVIYAAAMLLLTLPSLQMKQVLVEYVQQLGRLLYQHPCIPLLLSSSNTSTHTPSLPASEASTGGPAQQQ